ncbi:acetyl-CoA acetyltransferase [Altererythrobacter sp.]|uniref:acetyl-CoA acetyltransferase n=1 Tax=Altererythrobacter sp. TaxID=1872480 RepID=UPI003D0BD741
MIPGNTPVIIGVGQYSERVGEPGYEALSYMDLAGRALQAAIKDAGAAGDVAGSIDTLAAIRQFEISRPDSPSPFGRTDNPPRSIAQRVGANPKRAILEKTGGNGNQRLVGELAAEIASGRSEVAAIAGSEAVSTVRNLLEKGEKRDWSEHVNGEIEDRGYGLEQIIERELLAHGAGRPIAGYAILENARRRRLGLSLDEYRHHIGELFAPFTRIAANNPHSASPVERSADELAAVTARNRIVAEPYTRMTVSRDQVNQAAAVIIASAAKARELGVPEEKWVHIHAVTSVEELPVLARPDLSRSPAAILSLECALNLVGREMNEMAYLDFYSCFAIPVFNVIDHFSISQDDRRGLTLTGGLPFFGGAGNNYSTHAIAEAVGRCRADRGAYALVGANGGVMGKYATGIYSTEPADWSASPPFNEPETGEEGIPYASQSMGRATVESYTINHGRDRSDAIFIGRNAAGERVCGNADMSDEPTRALFESGDPFGAKLAITQDEHRRNIGRLASI